MSEHHFQKVRPVAPPDTPRDREDLIPVLFPVSVATFQRAQGKGYYDATKGTAEDVLAFMASQEKQIRFRLRQLGLLEKSLVALEERAADLADQLRCATQPATHAETPAYLRQIRHPTHDTLYMRQLPLSPPSSLVPY